MVNKSISYSFDKQHEFLSLHAMKDKEWHDSFGTCWHLVTLINNDSHKASDSSFDFLCSLGQLEMGFTWELRTVSGYWLVYVSNEARTTPVMYWQRFDYGFHCLSTRDAVPRLVHWDHMVSHMWPKNILLLTKIYFTLLLTLFQIS